MHVREQPEQESSPPSEPSAWQLRFRRKPTGASADRSSTVPVHTDSKPTSASSPSIAEQLLQSLSARENKKQPEQELSRQCAEKLLGKRNAFAYNLRMDGPAVEELLIYQDNNHDIAELAKDIIRSRMKIENEANVLRQASKQTKEMRGPRVVDHSAESTAERMRKLREEQSRWDQQSRPGSQPKVATSRKGESSRTVKHGNKSSVALHRIEETAVQRGILTTHHTRSIHTRQAPQREVSRTHANPIADMERRQAKIREMRETRNNRKAPAIKRGTNDTQGGTTHSNQREENEQRRLQERISRLKEENQHSAELAERVREQKCQWEAKSVVFSAWKRMLTDYHECVVYALEVFRWRKLQRTMKKWRHYSLLVRRERISSESRAQCAYEEVQLRKADIFRRKKQLPLWFYRWLTTYVAEKQRRQTEEAVKQRREQAQRLMERLVRGQEAPSSSESVMPESMVECVPQQQSTTTVDHPKPVPEPSALSYPQRQISTARTLTSNRPKQRSYGVDCITNSPPICSSKPSLAPPPPSSVIPRIVSSSSSLADPLYTSMRARANERKERRELLRLKYVRSQEEKRETLAMQIEDRAAALLRVREVERQRLLEQKRRAVAAARAKQERLKHTADLFRRARAANQQRLLRYYAFEPWKFYFECRVRVSKYAAEWHAMRVLHSSWLEWHALVAVRRTEKQQLEEKRLQSAGVYYEEVLRRRVWAAWKHHLQELEEIGQAIQHLSHRFVIETAFGKWRRRLQEERAIQYTRQAKIERELRCRILHRVVLAWKQAAGELKVRREREREKQQLWSKVRGWLDE